MRSLVRDLLWSTFSVCVVWLAQKPFTIHAEPAASAKAPAKAAAAPKLQSEFVFGALEAPVGSKYAWLNNSVFVGVAERLAAAAVIRFFEVK